MPRPNSCHPFQGRVETPRQHLHSAPGGSCLARAWVHEHRQTVQGVRRERKRKRPESRGSLPIRLECHEGAFLHQSRDCRQRFTGSLVSTLHRIVEAARRCGTKTREGEKRGQGGRQPSTSQLGASRGLSSTLVLGISTSEPNLSAQHPTLTVDLPDTSLPVK